MLFESHIVTETDKNRRVIPQKSIFSSILSDWPFKQIHVLQMLARPFPKTKGTRPCCGGGGEKTSLTSYLMAQMWG